MTSMSSSMSSSSSSASRSSSSTSSSSSSSSRRHRNRRRRRRSSSRSSSAASTTASRMVSGSSSATSSAAHRRPRRRPRRRRRPLAAAIALNIGCSPAGCDGTLATGDLLGLAALLAALAAPAAGLGLAGRSPHMVSTGSPCSMIPRPAQCGQLRRERLDQTRCPASFGSAAPTRATSPRTPGGACGPGPAPRSAGAAPGRGWTRAPCR